MRTSPTCATCEGVDFVHVGPRAIDACPRCTMRGEALWRDHLREVEAARLLSRKPPVERGKEAP